MEPEIPKEKPVCKHKAQEAFRLNASHWVQACLACKKILYEWQETFRDVREEFKKLGF